jgi:hypothetical protein
MEHTQITGSSNMSRKEEREQTDDSLLVMQTGFRKGTF